MFDLQFETTPGRLVDDDTAFYNTGITYPFFLENKNALVLALIKFRMY